MRTPGSSRSKERVDGGRVAREHQHVHHAAVPRRESAQRVEAPEMRAQDQGTATGSQDPMELVEARHLELERIPLPEP